MLANRDPQVRVAIANRLLDDGADAAAVMGSRTNLLHVFFTPQLPHDPAVETPLLKRLIEGGADVNLVDSKFGAPLGMLCTSNLRDEDAAGMYEAFFARPDLDLGAPANRVQTVRELIRSGATSNRPILQTMLLEREAQEGANHD